MIRNIVPEIMTEVIKSITQETESGKKDKKTIGKKDSEKKGKKSVTIFSSEEEDGSSDEETTKECNYGSFKKCNPLEFDGKKDATIACNWVSEMEAVIAISESRDNQAVKFTAHSFVSSSLHW